MTTLLIIVGICIFLFLLTIPISYHLYSHEEELLWDWDKEDVDSLLGERFPEKFLWGTATAAHQVEGGNDNNNWFWWESQVDKKGKPRTRWEDELNEFLSTQRGAEKGDWRLLAACREEWQKEEAAHREACAEEDEEEESW